MWFAYYPHVHINEKLQFYGDFGFRILITDAQWARIYGRPSVRYHLDSIFVLHGGFGLFLEANKDLSNRFELRPWQGVQIKWPTIRRWRFNHLVRIEERLNFLFQDEILEFEFRLRLRVGGRFQFDQMERGRSLFIPFNVEWFIPVAGAVNEFFIDRSQVELGLGYNASRILQFRFLINWRRSKTTAADDFKISDWTYRFQARYSLDFRTLDDDIQ